MIYKGYRLIPKTETTVNGVRHTGVAITLGLDILSLAQDMETAKHAVDTHTKSGLWPNQTKKG